MPHDLLLTPQLDQQRAVQLTRLAKRLDEQLDHPTGVLQSVAQSGLLEQLGILLWETTRLEADAVRTALDEARDAERPLRLVVQGEQAQHLPWELLYHARLCENLIFDKVFRPMQASAYLSLGCERPYCTGLHIPPAHPEVFSCLALTMPRRVDFLAHSVPTTDVVFSLDSRG